MEPEAKARLTRYIREHSKTELVDPETEVLREWLACINFMWDAIGKRYDATPTDEKQFDAYVKIFGSVPLGILENGITRAIANNGKYKTIPTPGAIWEAIRKNLELSDSADVFDELQTRIFIGWDNCIIRFEAQ